MPQSRLNVIGAATKLAADQLSAVATTVVTDVVLIQIRRAWHHDQRCRVGCGIRTTRPSNDGLKGLPAGRSKTSALRRPRG